MSIDAARYLEVDVDVRYWEDGKVNGLVDADGNIPMRKGDDWLIRIDLDAGVVVDWPAGVEASVHYKICDSGLYWLQDEKGERIAKWYGVYVPSDYLCAGKSGTGDYVILNIDGNGAIKDWSKPAADSSKWKLLG